MPALPTNIVSSLVNTQPQPRLKQVYLLPIDLAKEEALPWEVETLNWGNEFMGKQTKAKKKIALQYWPESLTDSRTSEWNPRNIPGGSHPIYQWTHGGERRLSFTAVFVRDKEPPEKEAGGFGLGGAIRSAASAVGLGEQQGDPARDAPIEAAVAWLRYFTYPLYKGGDLRVFEPPKVMLVFPGTALAHTGEDAVITVMTSCEVTYEAWFPSGKPRIVEVGLEFAEVVQSDNAVRFHSRGDMLHAGGVAPLRVNDDAGGGQTENIAKGLAGVVGL